MYMSEKPPNKPNGYWWQCDKNSNHWHKEFIISNKDVGLVRFFYELAKTNWDQSLLINNCTEDCDGKMRLTYDFPRQNDPERLSAIHIIGISNEHPEYLPMLWESKPHSYDDMYFDFKYVSWSEDRGYNVYGLAKPAVFNKSDLKKLFENYHEIVGHDIIPR